MRGAASAAPFFHVIPAKAGTHQAARETVDEWIPACAGMTKD